MIKIIKNIYEIINNIYKRVIVTINRINNFEYSFKLSGREGIRHVARALTFRNPDPFAYSYKIKKFDKRR